MNDLDRPFFGVRAREDAHLFRAVHRADASGVGRGVKALHDFQLEKVVDIDLFLEDNNKSISLYMNE
jgi:hypothetical protein